MKLSIIIPTFNEERTIIQVIERLQSVAFPIDYELIVVDDHSTDWTFTIEQAIGRHHQASAQTATSGPSHIRVLRNPVNKGKGASIRLGLKHATGDVIVVQDGDLEYHPRELLKLLPPLLEGAPNLAVVGSRFRGRRWPRGMGPASFAANHVLTWLTNALYGLRLSDMECCYKIVPTQLLRRARLRASRFEIDPELVAKLARAGVRFVERPIQYDGRSYAEGKKIRAKDFFLAVWVLIRWRVSPLPNSLR
jgi:glycosyltransferase involved in cell wall biosynthesis